ncbi:MAG: STAS domain-containing protein [Planctomycetota bacterium]|jgi:anti-sigma B factor antagonist|nr:STAS domain-containing protein [Planctomycetota bacterium]MDP7131015.1 STAS domain-containing protein [Planctomycetota bacterium]MDP7254379.1 STAS domain-containing protein [Planctomycetota bacterium]
MDTFTITEESADFGSGEAQCVRVGGYLDAGNIQQFEARINEIVGDSGKNIIVDLEELEYINSAGIGVLLNAWSALSQIEGSLQIANMPASIRRIFDVLGFSKVITIAESLEGALANLKNGSVKGES